MSTHSQLKTYEPWINQVVTQANTAIGLPDGVTVSDNFVLDFADDVPDDKILDMAVRMAGLDCKMRFHQCVLRYNIGRMILELCARTGQSEDYIIIDLGLHERTGLKVKTLCEWAGTVSRLPPSMLKPGVCWTALRLMGNIRPPEDPALLLELRQAQERVLEASAADPEECNTTFVAKEMKAVLEKLGVKKKEEPGGQQILLAYAILLRKLRYIEETDSTFESLGFKGRADIVDQIEACQNSLINLGVISEEVEK